MTCRCPVLPLYGPCSRCGTHADGLHGPGSRPTALYCQGCCPGEPTVNFTPQERLVVALALQSLAGQDRALEKWAAGRDIAPRQVEQALELLRPRVALLPAELHAMLPGVLKG